MKSSQDEDWELDLAPADFDSSCVSLSTQDNDSDTSVAKPFRIRKTLKITPEEDAKLKTLGEKYARDWGQIAVFFPGKTQIQLKKRWEKLQNSEGKRVRWTREEDESLLGLYRQMGGAWKAISQHFPGRTPDVVKNHFYSCLKKTLPEPPQRPEVPLPLSTPSDETLFSMLAISPPPEQPRSLLNPCEKLHRIQSLQGALTSLESMLLSTKVELKRMEEEMRFRHK